MFLSCIKGNKDLIFLLFGKHPANQMISVLSWPKFREIRILFPVHFPKQCVVHIIMWLLSACMRGNKDLTSLLSFSAASSSSNSLRFFLIYIWKNKALIFLLPFYVSFLYVYEGSYFPSLPQHWVVQNNMSFLGL